MSNDAEIHQALQEAHSLLQRGEGRQAAEICARVLGQDPNRHEALYLLGAAALRAGQPEKAAETLGRAVAVAPGLAEYHHALGRALASLRRIPEATASLRKAVELSPERAELHLFLGSLLEAAGERQPAESIAEFEAATRLRSDLPEAHYALGMARLKNGAADLAAEALREATRLRPAYSDAHAALGRALKLLRQPEAAAEAYRRVITLSPDSIEAHFALAATLYEQKRDDEAIENLERIARRWPDNADVQYQAGALLFTWSTDKMEEAAVCFRRALAVRQDHAAAWNGLANVVKAQGRHDEAMNCYRKAMALRPTSPAIHSNLVLEMHYHPDITPEEIHREHLEWGRRHADPLSRLAAPFANGPDPDRPLRIGYMSGVFIARSVGFFLEPFLAKHDHERFEIFAYNTTNAPDAVTQRLRACCDGWRAVHKTTPGQIAALVREDRIDILVDLAGHSAPDQMLAFAHRPAPVQVAYLGYPDTTGMSAMDYRFTDSFADPPGATEKYHTEELIRLDPCAWCFRPPDGAPAVLDVPALAAGHVTFGSFNYLAKMNERVVALWASILQATPGSRLLLKYNSLAGEQTRRDVQRQFARHGIAPERLELVGWLERPEDHLSLYNRVDVALDPFPYHGTTTTCEALWMGVPVVTLAGRAHVMRVGVSLLNNVGLPSLVAESEQQYRSIACDLAGDLAKLSARHRELRPKMAASPLMDAEHFTRRLESAYRQMWARWCKAQNALQPD